MSENAQTLIKAALRSIGAIATGETPTDDEIQDGFEAMKLMLRSWSARNIRLYYTKQESVAMTGATSYSIGDSGDINTVRPTSIRGAWTDVRPVKIITEDRYRSIRMSSGSGDVEYLWYSPENPLGLLYPWPKGGTTLYIDSLKPLTEPGDVTTDLTFPPEYEDAIKWNLAVRLAPEYEKNPSQIVVGLAVSTLKALETVNFANQINAIRTEPIRLSHARYNIDEG